jgi:hypothetical protein
MALDVATLTKIYANLRLTLFVNQIGTIGSVNETCQTYPRSRMSYGHTFRFPDPFSKDLGSVYQGAAYMVEVKFADGSAERGLIASPDLRQSTDLRFYSFNVAISRRPTSVKSAIASQ